MINAIVDVDECNKDFDNSGTPFPSDLFGGDQNAYNQFCEQAFQAMTDANSTTSPNVADAAALISQMQKCCKH